ILDCCFAGRAVPAMSAELKGMVDIDGVYVLTAAGRNIPASAPPDARNTAFTGQLLDVLRDGIPGGAPLLTLDAIFHDVRSRMRRNGFPQPEAVTNSGIAHLALVRNAAHGSRRPRHRSEGPGGYRLAIDFGTSNTVAVVHRPGGTTRILTFDNSALLPSGVCATEKGDLVTGQDAVHLAQRRPGYFEAHPKKRIAE